MRDDVTRGRFYHIGKASKIRQREARKTLQDVRRILASRWLPRGRPSQAVVFGLTEHYARSRHAHTLTNHNHRGDNQYHGKPERGYGTTKTARVLFTGSGSLWLRGEMVAGNSAGNSNYGDLGPTLRLE